VTELAFLQDLVIILGAAVVVVGLLRRLHVPPIAGFIVAGAIIGPHALQFVNDPHQVELLAEVGVVLLLFGVGLELSLDRLRRLWRFTLLGGASQVVATVLVVWAVSALLGQGGRTGLLLGFIVAISSTAIVLRGLSARAELDAPHGRLTLGILVFQDLCVVPMVLVIPFLADAGTGGGVGAPLLTAAVVVVGVLMAARLVVPRFLDAVARTRQRELFVLAVFLICLGTAWAVSSAGVSLALGAFLAGLVVSGSRYREQAIADLVPSRDVLVSVFFVSIGMLLDLQGVLRNLLPILGLFAAIVVGKFVMVLLVASAMRLPLRVGVLTAAALAQVGEFSFVLLQAANGTGLLTQPLAGNLTVAIILSMLATPFAIAAGPHLAAALGRLNGLHSLLEVRTTSDLETEATRDHVIIAGYGLTGRTLANVLARSATPYIIVDINTDNVREAERLGQSACFGDVTSVEVLEHLGTAHARELVIAINDADATERATRAARRSAPNLRITVRTAYELDVERLRKAGATHVVTAEYAAAGAVVARVMGNAGDERAPWSQAREASTGSSPKGSSRIAEPAPWHDGLSALRDTGSQPRSRTHRVEAFAGDGALDALVTESLVIRSRHSDLTDSTNRR
jgi:CPA2 family monovalent cation:H+ antiporter-2